MPRLDAVHWTLALAFAGVLAWAALSDIATRRIPNQAVLALLAIFAGWALAGAPASLGSSLAAGLIGLTVGFGLYLFRVMGAGDAKLFAATALFGGLAYLPMLALATAVAGGVIAIGSLLAQPRRALVLITLRWEADHGRGVPYGVAISIGGVLTLWALTSGVTLADILHPMR
jgi:prepilin peptidase CpaA